MKFLTPAVFLDYIERNTPDGTTVTGLLHDDGRYGVELVHGDCKQLFVLDASATEETRKGVIDANIAQFVAEVEGTDK